jgi:4-amino-4-deoxy-L-arabinose transferase-like glycosyltransferase
VIGYDDGVYLSSVLAMRAGGAPFRDVYSSQGPVFLPLLRLADRLGFGVPWAARLVPMTAALAMVVITYLLSRQVGGRWHATVAASLVATSGLLVFSTVRVDSDAVVAALAAGAVLAAMMEERRWSVVAVFLIGLAVGVKSLMAGPALLAVLWLLGRRHRPRAALAALVAVGAVVVVVSLPWGLAAVWDQSVRLHLLARQNGWNLPDRLYLVRDTLWQYDRVLVTVTLISAAAGLVRLVKRRRNAVAAPHREVTAALWLWMAASVAVVAVHSPLWTQHLTMLLIPAAVLAVRLRPPLLLVAIVAGALLPAHVANAGWRLSQPRATRDELVMVDTLRSIQPADGLVISDEPTLTWMANRVSPGQLVDTSYVRIGAGQLTKAQVVAAASEPGVCAVLLWSGRLDGLTGIRTSFDGYRRVVQHGGHELLLRDSCHLGPS